MLRNSSTINGYTIVASDGQIGTVSDLLFDDASWLIRWVVVDTGNWLSSRKVLLPVSVLGHLDSKEEKFAVRLTMQQVKDSPDIDSARPVSRQMETLVYDYYGWSPYWSNSYYMGGYSYMGGVGYLGGPGFLGSANAASPSPESLQREEDRADRRKSDNDPHLRSIEAVTGYHIHATDGEIGHVEDFLLEDVDWSIHYLVVDTKNWWPAKKVLISPRSAREINWTDKLVNLNVDRKTVKNGPEYDDATTIDRAYEKNFHSYYGDIRTGS